MFIKKCYPKSATIFKEHYLEEHYPKERGKTVKVSLEQKNKQEQDDILMCLLQSHLIISIPRKHDLHKSRRDRIAIYFEREIKFCCNKRERINFSILLCLPLFLRSLLT